MSRTIRTVVAALALLIHTSAARAVISAVWRPVASGNGSIGTTYPSAAILADPALLNLQTWDLLATTDGNWASAGLRATLPPGSAFYRSTSAAITKPEVVTANREFWTYVAAPQDDLKFNNILILGGFPEGQPVSNGTGNGTNVPGVLSVHWGDLINDLPGTYDIARLTFPLGVMPDVLTADQSQTFSFTAQVTPNSSVAIPEIPEPAAGALTVAIACALPARRRLARRGRSERE